MKLTQTENEHIFEKEKILSKSFIYLHQCLCLDRELIVFLVELDLFEGWNLSRFGEPSSLMRAIVKRLAPRRHLSKTRKSIGTSTIFFKPKIFELEIESHANKRNAKIDWIVARTWECDEKPMRMCFATQKQLKWSEAFTSTSQNQRIHRFTHTTKILLQCYFSSSIVLH